MKIKFEKIREVLNGNFNKKTKELKINGKNNLEAIVTILWLRNDLAVINIKKNDYATESYLKRKIKTACTENRIERVVFLEFEAKEYISCEEIFKSINDNIEYYSKDENLELLKKTNHNRCNPITLEPNYINIKYLEKAYQNAKICNNKTFYIHGIN